MQKRVVEERDAERVGPSWYLSRDGEQIGPLTDRELSLFADGGNFRPGDLLWTAGLDGWKPAEAIFRLKETESAGETQGAAEPQDAVEAQDADQPIFVAQDAAMEEDDENLSLQLSGDTGDRAFDLVPWSGADMADTAEPDVIEPTGEDVTALVQALKGETAPPKLTLKERALQELKTFAGIFIYLWVVFTVLLLHEWLVLSDHHIGFAFYGLATLNALGVGKVMVIAEHFRFAEHLKQKPLIYPIAYKTAAFTTLLLAAYALEVMLIGWIGGHGFLASAPAYGGVIGTLSLWLIFCVALMPYFAFKEFERAVGPDMIRKLLLGRR